MRKGGRHRGRRNEGRKGGRKQGKVSGEYTAERGGKGRRKWREYIRIILPYKYIHKDFAFYSSHISTLKIKLLKEFTQYNITYNHVCLLNRDFDFFLF